MCIVVLTPPPLAWGWAELLHEEEKTYENLREVRAEIQKETNRIAGVNKVRSTLTTPSSLTVQ